MTTLLYESVNLINGKNYVGVTTKHVKNLLYFGSGDAIKAAVALYGKKNFIRKDLAIFDIK